MFSQIKSKNVLLAMAKLGLVELLPDTDKKYWVKKPKGSENQFFFNGKKYKFSRLGGFENPFIFMAV